MLCSVPNTNFGPVIAAFYVSVISAAIGEQNHLHKHFFFFLKLIQTEWRGSYIQSYSMVSLSVDTEFNMTSKTFLLPPNSFSFLLFYSLLKQW